MITSANPGASRATDVGLNVVVVAAHTSCFVCTSNNLDSTVARSYWLTCCTGTIDGPNGLPQPPPQPQPMPPDTIVVDTWVRVSTRSSLTSSSPWAPLFATAAANAASPARASSAMTV